MWDIAAAMIGHAEQARLNEKHNEVQRKNEEEVNLRTNNPGVKDAWEKYQILLKLNRE